MLILALCDDIFTFGKKLLMDSKAFKRRRRVGQSLL